MSTPPLDLVHLLLHTDDSWRIHGRCNDNNGTLSHLFFADDVVSIARAKAICARCPVSRQCLDSALRRREPGGVWGGELVESGRIQPEKAPRGRPPIVPRAPLSMDEVPVPPSLVTSGN